MEDLMASPACHQFRRGSTAEARRRGETTPVSSPGSSEGQKRGERIHKARHTAGQRVLDATQGNLKAVQKLLGHSSISTTGDIYTD
jgi:site-specific recombinase XerC